MYIAIPAILKLDIAPCNRSCARIEIGGALDDINRDVQFFDGVPVNENIGVFH